mgnify:FL=1
MQKLRSIAAILNAVMPSDLKSYLVQKMENIEKTYHCDISDSLSVILLEKQEQSYLLDKGLEFYEILSFSHADWIHTVWASSDGYSEDIYIPFSTETQKLVERRCC